MGTFVAAEIEGRDAGQLVLLPRHALQSGTRVWIVKDDQTIYPREVEIVRRDDTHVYINSGLAVGELYLLTPIDQPLPGMKVRISG